MPRLSVACSLTNSSMAVPKQRKTKSRQGARRSHLGLSKKQLTQCSHCGKPALPHRVCSHCGYYKGRKVIDVFADLDKEEKEKKQKEIEEKSEEEQTKKGLSLEELSKK